MQPQRITPSPVPAPRLALAESELCARFGGPVVRVLAGLSVDGHRIDMGDLLLLDPGAVAGDLVVVVARGRGRPMLARMSEAGPVGVPSGVPFSRSRWRVLGRVIAQVRPSTPAQDKVLTFPAARAQGMLPLAPSSLEQGVAVLRLDRAPTQEMVELVAERQGALRVRGSELQLPLGELSLESLGALVRDLGLRFGVRVRGALAMELEHAQAACALMSSGQVARVLPGQELLPSAVERELAQVQEEERMVAQAAQLTLF